MAELELTTFQRWIIGIALASVTSMSSVLEGLVIFSYYHNYNVTPSNLSLSNFIVGLLGLCVSILVGNLHQYIKSYKRILMMIFSVIYAIAILLRYGTYLLSPNTSSTSSSDGAIYYVSCYSFEIIGRTGLSILQDTWVIESFHDTERRKLYPIVTTAGICGIILGLLVASFLPLDIIGIILSTLILTANSFIVLLFYREPPATEIMSPETEFETWTRTEGGISSVSPSSPQSKKQRILKIPNVTTIASVFENSQYLICLLALIGFWFYKSLPSLFMFFLSDVMKIHEDHLSMVYVFCVLSYILGGILAYPLTRYYTKPSTNDNINTTTITTIDDSDEDQKYSLARFALIGGAIGYGALFLVSYLHWSLVVVCLLIIGLTNTSGSTIFRIFCADCVDYDQFLTKMKRPEAYVSVTNPISTLIAIASVSIPLAVMSLCGFETNHGEDDGTSDNDTMASTLVLRLWCGVILGVLCVISYLILRNYKVSLFLSMCLTILSLSLSLSLSLFLFLSLSLSIYLFHAPD
jgi:Na+/melibiose symporter-like transporter